jgi:asparagine synthase (glutamine-hydrolysing)
MISASGRWVLVFNGEIYNFQDLRTELEASGCRFRGGSDTEVLLGAIEHWGVMKALQAVNGMFALAVWDCQRRELHVARDRLGEKPLYYGRNGDRFFFGSELKAFRAHRSFVPSIDRDAIALLLQHGYIPAPWSVYEGIQKLLPGTVLTMEPLGNGYRQGMLRRYWSLADVARDGLDRRLRLDDLEAADMLEETLADAVRIRMIADVPLGAFLSGGIDSSVVVALMQAHSDRPVKTFTIGFDDPSFNEAESGAAVAKHLGTDHTELYVTAKDALMLVPAMAEIYDEPFADASQLPTTLLARLTRQHVTVSLSGDGGDELFAGYDRYARAIRIWARISRLPRAVRAGVGRGVHRINPRTWDRALAHVHRIYPALSDVTGRRIHRVAEVLGARNFDELYLQLLSQWQHPEDVVIGGGDASILDLQPRRDGLEPYERMMLLDAATYLPDDILVKVDRATMSVSLEARVPLLDHRLVEFAWSLPPNLKVRDGQTKWLLRQVLHRYIPAALVDRPKMGFGVPIGAWLRGPLRPWAEELLREDRLRREGHLNPTPIRTAWAEHLNGQDRQYQLWSVLMFESWLEREETSAGV